MNNTVPKKRSAAEKKANVQVAVRVRPLSATERSEKSTLSIVKADAATRSVSLRQKTFSGFDRVYGPNSTQVDIYKELVAPQIEDVLSGYNCTIFAYGQTGTGKTHTMEGGNAGDPEIDWETDKETGIIPRAVQQIFTQLIDQDSEDYVVRVSYVELYNEELYDLLAPSGAGETCKPRLYEDPSKKGAVMISGAEEVPVRCREEVYKLLKRGGEKRRTAETLMNLRSSRSHSVFTISVVLRESTAAGDELVKQGKLHLVDLAGSENVGRSGAEGKRAKEAGQINTSLLTLGRVITALTTNAPHVPYRESKLTRLLQDSLGGSTITTIIATISPTNCSYEESYSTLDYANKAKNIQNHPEVNQKLSRKDLFKEYALEIEKLRKDLRNARDKNGVFLDPERLEGMETEIRDKQEKIETLEEELISAVEKMTKFMENMQMMDEHYKLQHERLRKVEDRLAERIQQVEALNMQLAEKTEELHHAEFVLEKLNDYGDEAHRRATKMRKTVLDLEKECGFMHEKCAALRERERRNIQAKEEVIARTSDECQCLAENVKGDAEERKKHVEVISSASENLVQNTVSSLKEGSAIMEKAEKDIGQAITSIHQLTYQMAESTAKFSSEERNSVSEAVKNVVERLESTEKAVSAHAKSQHQLTSSITQKYTEIINNFESLLSKRKAEVDKHLDEVALRRDEQQEDIGQYCQQMEDILANIRRCQKSAVDSEKKARESLKDKLHDLDEEAATIQQDGKEKMEDLTVAQTRMTEDSMKDNIREIEAMRPILSGLSAETAVRTEELREELRLAADRVSAEAASVQKKVVNTRSEVCERMERVSTVIDDKTGEIGKEAAMQREVAMLFCESELRGLRKLDGSVKEAAEEISAVPITGCTPEKKSRNVPRVEAPPPLDALFQMAAGENADTTNQRRASVYRVRDSILLPPDVSHLPLSPSALARKLNEDIIEEEVKPEKSSNRRRAGMLNPRH